MKNKLMSGHFADGMNFKRPCWLALFVSLGMMLVGYNAFYGMFPYADAEAGNTWQVLMENGLFLLMVVGAIGFVASLIWWLLAAIEFRFQGSRRRSAAALSMLGMVTTLCLCGGSLQAQDNNGGGPGGPPPGQPGDGGSGGPGGPGGDGGPGGPPPGDLGNGGPDGPGNSAGNGGPGGNFDPAQFQQRMMDQIRQNLNVTNDDEWAAIQPLVQKVMEARREAGGPGGRGRPGAQASSEQQALQKAIEAGAPVTQIKEALAKCRAARKDKQAKLEAAQTNLKSVLSVKQEAQAVLLGLLP